MISAHEAKQKQAIEHMFYTVGMGPAAYAELHAHSAFTFLEGSSQPEELVAAARNVGLEALAVLDVDGMYSAIQSATAARLHRVPYVHGAELTLDPTYFVDLRFNEALSPGWGLVKGADEPGIRLPFLAQTPEGYTRLCRAMSEYTLSHPGQRFCRHYLPTLAEHAGGQWAVLTGSARGPLRRALRSEGIDGARKVLRELIELFGSENVLVESVLTPTDPPELADTLAELAQWAKLPLVATGAVRSATPAGQHLADVLTATRLHATLTQVEAHLPAQGAFLRSAEEMCAIHWRHPQAVRTAAEYGREFAFDLRLIAPELPRAYVPAGHTDATWLRELTYRGAQERYGTREEHPRAWRTIDHELEVIEALTFPGYFLIVKEIVDFCAQQGIYCQGRGSAANSAVCYALGITAVDAVQHQLLFERFLSTGRSGPPDIDIDIESERREEVIQHVYARYGREYAAQVATVISYRARSATYDAAKALGFPEEVSRAWSKNRHRWEEEEASTIQQLTQESPADTDNNRREQRNPSPTHTAVSISQLPTQVRRVADALKRLPRHMGIHTGGMVLTKTPVSEVCPISWAATPDRSVLQWDKDDCADAGLVKFDLLGLGMLSALRRGFQWIESFGERGDEGTPYSLHNLPHEDPRIYDLLCAADTVGVFQVESRAQMNTLPRLRPRCFYDIVVEVALIRPGPIQGQAVNPYLRRRRGEEAITYLHEALKPALEKTMGVAIFQEQLMQIAMDAAGFTPAQADELRRAMGSKRSPERMAALYPLLVEGMAERGIGQEVADQVYRHLQGFAEFGFPESHAFSFAHLVYSSSWMKVYYPEVFYAALLASQPMGFYSPASLVHDARRHGVRVGRPDVNLSQIKAHPRLCCEEQDAEERRWSRGVRVSSRWELRLGLDSIAGLGEAARRIVDARGEHPFVDSADLARRARLSRHEMDLLAQAGALESMGIERRAGMWEAAQVGGEKEEQAVLPGLELVVPSPQFDAMNGAEVLVADYETMRVTPESHPIEHIRQRLDSRGVSRADRICRGLKGQIVSVAGLVTHRQAPATGKGIVFLSLEDETGLINITCSAGMWKRFSTVGRESSALIVRGMVEEGHGAVSILAHHMEPIAGRKMVHSRDFR